MRPLSIEGSWIHEPKVFPDERGSVHELFQGRTLRGALGQDLKLAQAGRRRVARRYAEGLSDLCGPGGLTLPTTAAGNEHVYYVYVVRHPRRDEIIRALKERYDISLNISYPWPVHTMRGFAHLGVEASSLPVTERLAGEIFSLPMYPSLSEAVQDKVIDALHEVLRDL